MDGPSEKGLKLPPNDCNWPAIHPKPQPFTKTLHKRKHRFFHCQRLSLLGSCQRNFLSGPFEQRDKLVTIYIYKKQITTTNKQCPSHQGFISKYIKGPYHSGVGGWGYKGWVLIFWRKLLRLRLTWAGPGCQKSEKCLPTGFQITVSIIWMTKLMTKFGGGM